MSSFYRRWVRPILFRCDPEKAHSWTLNSLAALGRSPVLCDLAHEFFAADALPVARFGIRFPNPIGLAAGMDKNGVALPSWQALGFGFCEIGGITRHPQPGNPKPRLFRIPETDALINRMGFNNCGADALAAALQKSRHNRQFPLAINLGKSKQTPLEEAGADFAYSFGKLWSLADFFVVNISSPNTPGLRTLQEKPALTSLLKTLTDTNRRLAASNSKSRPASPEKPLLIKISPDLADTAIEDIVELALAFRLAGIVATNTSKVAPARSLRQGRQKLDVGSPPPQPLFESLRPNHSSSVCPTLSYPIPGGLSGQPLRQRSTEIIRRIASQTRGSLTIIGVGGIHDAESAWEKIAAGAHLCQLYSGLVFQGPSLVSEIVRGLINQLRRHNIQKWQQAVGSNLPFRTS